MLIAIAKTEGALGPKFCPRAQWFASRAIYNKARSFDTSGAADVWLPDLRTGIPKCSGQHRIHLGRVWREGGQHDDGHRGCR
jgi:hypothetical protein